MTAYWLDPLSDPRWVEFVDRHPSASIFHTPAWLDALRRTYGYEPAVLTTTLPSQELTNGIALCRISSRLTGRRLLSLPFSDHCHPLADTREDLACLGTALLDALHSERLKYIELRPLGPTEGLGLPQSQSYYFHRLDLLPNIDEIMRAFHRDCVLRKIRRAERDGLVCEEGRSTALINEFYRLQLMTRRRLGLPPQPTEWFRNLADALGERLSIRVARLGHRPAASILMLRHGRSLVFKYGCSDAALNRHGGMQLLLWQAIQQAKKDGLEELDLGRSDFESEGLVSFKDHWGAEKTTLIYRRYPAKASGHSVRRLALRVFAHLPESVLVSAGRLIYKHIG